MTQPSQENPGRPLQPNPEEVNEFHRYSDVDNGPDSQHHTLGIDPNQSSPGDHTHNGRTSRTLSGYAQSNHNHDGTYLTGRRIDISFDLPSIAANTTTSHDIVVTTGSISTNDIVLYMKGIVDHGLFIQGVSVPAVDTVRVAVSNTTAAAVDPVASTFTFVVIDA